MSVLAYIGIDPGASGYICLLEPRTGQAVFMANSNPIQKILSTLNDWQTECIIPKIVIEEVTSIQGASARSNFTFGYNVGYIRATAEASGIGVDLVRPKVWQKEVGVKTPVSKKGVPKLNQNQRTKLHKERIAQVADRLYPNINIRGPKGGLIDGMADSLLIAHYCFLTYQ